MAEGGAAAGRQATTWRFPGTFWIANGVELFERAAYYGMFIALSLYLTSAVGFTDVEAGWIAAVFSSVLYLLPFFTGAVADRMGFRPSLLLAFVLLAAGYGLLGLEPSKALVFVALPLVMLGGAFVKPIISGTVAKCSDSANRARAFSLFYMMVNIGSFTGKTVAKPVRTMLGVQYVPLYSAGAAAVAFLVVLFLYWPKENGAERPKDMADAARDLITVLRNGRFLALILITAGFWAIQGQLYASLPKYVIRMIGAQASPEWYANVDPLIVVLMVVPVTHLARLMKPVGSIGIALALIPCAALCMALSGAFTAPVHLAGMSVHPVTLMMVLGAAIMGLAECFLSPRYYEFASKQAPPGQEGLYMGYCTVNTFFAWLFGFALSGYLLDAFCPDPDKLKALGYTAAQTRAAYAHAPYLWYAFAAVGAVAFLALMVFMWVTERRDRRAGRA